MSLFYALIARSNEIVLCEYTEISGNFPQITRSIIKKIKRNTRSSYTYKDKFVFHYINENDITYLALADSKFNLKIAHQFLEDVKQRFNNKYNSHEEIHTAIAFGLNGFKIVLKERMVRDNC